MANFHATTLNMRKEIQRSYLFRVTFTGVGDLANVLMSSAKLPSLVIGEKKLPLLSTYFKVADMVNFDTWTATFMDVEEGTIYKHMYDWQEKVYNRAGYYVGLPSDYKENATLDLLKVSGEKGTTYKVEGIFPLTITAGDLAHSNNDMFKYTVTFAMDRFTVV